MLIIIEGPDNTGKTTLALHLAEIFGLEYKHCSKPKSDSPFHEYIEMFKDIKVPTVIDRAHLGEFVYSQLWRDGCSITEKQFKLIDLEAMSRFEYTIVIHAQAPDDVISERCIKEKEDLLQQSQIVRCSELFREITAKTQIPIVNYYSNIEKPEDISRTLCEMGMKLPARRV